MYNLLAYAVIMCVMMTVSSIWLQWSSSLSLSISPSPFSWYPRNQRSYMHLLTAEKYDYNNGNIEKERAGRERPNEQEE